MTTLQPADSIPRRSSSILGRVTRLISVVCLVAVTIVFVQAAVPKIMDPLAFARSIQRYGILPDVFINPLAIILPWLEVMAVLSLFIRRLRLAGGAILIGLLLVFIAAVGSALVRGLDISCGCFSTGPDAAKIGWTHLLRNAGLIVLVVLAVWNRGPHKEVVPG